MFRDNLLPFIVQFVIGTVCIPTYISWSYIEHLYALGLGYCIADYLCHSSLSCELFMLHDNLHHLMPCDVLSSMLSYSYVTQ